VKVNARHGRNDDLINIVLKDLRDYVLFKQYLFTLLLHFYLFLLW